MLPGASPDEVERITTAAPRAGQRPPAFVRLAALAAGEVHSPPAPVAPVGIVATGGSRRGPRRASRASGRY